MSKRLQVLFDEEELVELREIARRNHMSLAEWARCDAVLLAGILFIWQ